MKNLIGAIRPIDALGRVVIPSEIRYALNWSNKDKINIVMNGDSVVLEKYDPKDLEEKTEVVEGLKFIMDELSADEKMIVKRAIKYMDKY